MVKKTLCCHADVWFDSINGAYVEVDAPANGKIPAIHRVVDLDSFAHSLSGSCREKREKKLTFKLGRVPQFMYDLSLETDAKGEIVKVIAYFAVPGTRRTFQYTCNDKGELAKGGKDRVTEIPYPNLLFKAEAARNGSVLHTQQLNVWAYKDQYISDSTALFKYPLGNVFEGGKVCMGGFGLNVTGLLDLFGYVMSFFMLKTNNDLYSAALNSTGKKQSEFIEELSKLDMYPLDTLVPLDLTVGKICGENKMEVQYASL